MTKEEKEWHNRRSAETALAWKWRKLGRMYYFLKILLSRTTKSMATANVIEYFGLHVRAQANESIYRVAQKS
jgi:hypothetical protein